MAAYFCVVRGTVCLPRRREGPRKPQQRIKRNGAGSRLYLQTEAPRSVSLYAESDAVRPVIVDEAAVGDDLPLVVGQVAEIQGELLLRAVGTQGKSLYP